MNKISCRLELLPGDRVLDKLRAAAKYGFDAVGLPGKFLDEYLDDLRSSYQYSPLPFSSISLGFEGSLVDSSKGKRKKCRLSILRVLDLCRELSIPFFNMPPALSCDHPGIAGDSEELDRLLLFELSLLAEEAEKRGVVILLEPVNRYESVYMNTLQHASRVCETLDRPYIKITADLFHMQLEELSFYNSIVNAGPSVGYVHVAENTRCEPGPGSMDFETAFRALKKIEYSGFLEIESRYLSGDPETVLPKAINYIKSLISEVK